MDGIKKRFARVVLRDAERCFSSDPLSEDQDDPNRVLAPLSWHYLELYQFSGSSLVRHLQCLCSRQNN